MQLAKKPKSKVKPIYQNSLATSGDSDGKHVSYIRFILIKSFRGFQQPAPTPIQYDDDASTGLTIQGHAA